jgi:HSP20 family protein
MWEDKFTRDILKMRKKMDRLFTNIGDGIRRAWADFVETDDEYIMHVELPGIDREEIILEVVGNRMEIRAEIKKEIGNVDKGEHINARSYLGFVRSMDLPEDSNVEKIEADYKNGVLIVKIRKKEGSERIKRRIEVR